MIVTPHKVKITPSLDKKSPAQIERYELKYVIRPELVPQIRSYLLNFCAPDPYAQGNPPEYIATTLQLDNHKMELALAKENKLLNRFKLRIRTYGLDGKSPVFFEIKRKVNNTIVKSRARMAFQDFTRENVHNPKKMVKLLSYKENEHFIEFLRLKRQVGAEPKMLIRYHRESYFSTNDAYARVSFDRRLQYRPARGHYDFALDKRGWSTMDTPTALRGLPTGVILELKTGINMPIWMQELIERFRLVRTGFCKYATAVRLETIFQGYQYSDTSENTTYS